MWLKICEEWYNYNLEGPQEYYGKLNKAALEGQILYDVVWTSLFSFLGTNIQHPRDKK